MTPNVPSISVRGVCPQCSDTAGLDQPHHFVYLDSADFRASFRCMACRKQCVAWVNPNSGIPPTVTVSRTADLDPDKFPDHLPETVREKIKEFRCDLPRDGRPCGGRAVYTHLEIRTEGPTLKTPVRLACYRGRCLSCEASAIYAEELRGPDDLNRLFRKNRPQSQELLRTMSGPVCGWTNGPALEFDLKLPGSAVRVSPRPTTQLKLPGKDAATVVEVRAYLLEQAKAGRQTVAVCAGSGKDGITAIAFDSREVFPAVMFLEGLVSVPFVAPPAEVDYAGLMPFPERRRSDLSFVTRPSNPPKVEAAPPADDDDAPARTEADAVAGRLADLLAKLEADVKTAFDGAVSLRSKIVVSSASPLAGGKTPNQAIDDDRRKAFENGIKPVPNLFPGVAPLSLSELRKLDNRSAVKTAPVPPPDAQDDGDAPIVVGPG